MPDDWPSIAKRLGDMIYSLPANGSTQRGLSREMHELADALHEEAARADPPKESGAIQRRRWFRRK